LTASGRAAQLGQARVGAENEKHRVGQQILAPYGMRSREAGAIYLVGISSIEIFIAHDTFNEVATGRG